MLTTARTVYRLATDPECALPEALVPEIRAELRRFSGLGTALAGRVETAKRWSAAQAGRYHTLGAGVDDRSDRTRLARHALLGCTPLAAMAGAWLQWLTSPGNAEEPERLQILAVYADDVGASRPQASRGAVFRSLLRHFELTEQAGPACGLAFDRRIAEQAFTVPALLLAMSRRPDDFLPEIMGADLCLRHIGVLPALALVRCEAPQAVDWAALDLGAPRRQPRSPLEQCDLVVRQLPADRVALGFDWAFGTLRENDNDFYDLLVAHQEPAFEMAELMRLRAHDGAMYHHGVRVEGRSLAEWMTECRADPGPFLSALARSAWVRPGLPEASPLTTGLVGDDGPMFRVFAADDVAVMQRWITALPGGAGPSVVPARQSVPVDLPSIMAAQECGSKPADLRAAYHRLQQRTGSAALRRYCLQYTRGRLEHAARDLDGETQLPRCWPVDGLRPWLAKQHAAHARAFAETSDEPVPSRQQLIDSTVQLAPLTLIDGSWLQGFTDYDLASGDVGHALFATYWDELGNGEPRLNHPRIYRELLAEMDLVLPETGSPEFAASPVLLTESFALPVFWLSIGRFPQTFLPEILGLNLAMELSGVGGSYRAARLALRHHGFSTRFVDIHNTIDNVDTGHAAWASDAVDSHMATVSGEAGRVAVWQRVRSGYRALTPPRTALSRSRARLKEVLWGV